MEEKQKFVARVGSCRLDEVKDDFSNLEARPQGQVPPLEVKPNIFLPTIMIL